MPGSKKRVKSNPVTGEKQLTAACKRKPKTKKKQAEHGQQRRSRPPAMKISRTLNRRGERCHVSEKVQEPAP